MIKVTKQLVALATAAFALALPCPAGAVTVNITAPADDILSWSGPYDVAYKFITAPTANGGNICNNLASDCSVNGSLAIQKIDTGANGGIGAITLGPEGSSAQTFIIDPGASILFGAQAASDGTWSYDSAPAAVTSWATKGGSHGYTLFWLVPDGTAAASAGFLGIDALVNTAYPYVTFDWLTGKDAGQCCRTLSLSNITWFNMDPLPPSRVPEPGGLWLAGLALVGAAAARRSLR
jgi:hypothetical protein